MSGKGYVVRGKARGSERVFYVAAPDGVEGYLSTSTREKESELGTIAKAIEAYRYAWRLRDVRIFALGEDGTETPLPTYEQALALCDAWKALAKAREGLRTGPRDDKAAPVFAIQMGEAIKALAALGVPYSETLGDLT